MRTRDPNGCDEDETGESLALSIAERVPQKSRIVFKTIGDVAEQGIASAVQRHLVEMGYDVIRIISYNVTSAQGAELTFDFGPYSFQVTLCLKASCVARAEDR